MDKVFKALADPTRRELLDRLNEEQGQTLSSLCEGIGMRRQSVTKHLLLLEEAGLVVVQWDGREKIHFLNPVPISEIAARWIDKYSKSKTEALTNLKKAIETREKEKRDE